MIIRKSPAELEKMRRSGLLVWKILQEAGEMVVEGVTTMDLEVGGRKDDRRMPVPGRPSRAITSRRRAIRYPYVLCTSVNEEIVHGMPSAKRVLKKGDIVSIDTGVQLNGYYGDSAVTVPVGEISDEARSCWR